jgi:hypothetical protein
MRRPLLALAAALLLQCTLTGTGHAASVTVDQTVEASTQRGVRVAGQDIGKVTNPRVRISFNVDPDLVGVSVENYGGGANPDDPHCPADHDPLGSGTANATVVADLQAGAIGTRELVVEYTETHADGTVHTHEAYSSTEPIGPIGPAGEVQRVPLCIYNP